MYTVFCFSVLFYFMIDSRQLWSNSNKIYIHVYKFCFIFIIFHLWCLWPAVVDKHYTLFHFLSVMHRLYQNTTLFEFLYVKKTICCCVIRCDPTCGRSSLCVPVRFTVNWFAGIVYYINIFLGNRYTFKSNLKHKFTPNFSCFTYDTLFDDVIMATASSKLSSDAYLLIPIN